MYPRPIISRSISLLIHRNCSHFSRLKKFAFIIQKLLNKMANDEPMTFKQKIQSEQSIVPSQQGQPKSLVEAQNRFVNAQKALSSHEKHRLQKIDELLGTNTYFHETRVDQQKIDSQHVLKISQLKTKTTVRRRYEIDSLNPQMPKPDQIKRKRKLMKLLKRIKTYPSGNIDLVNFSQTNTSDPNIISEALMKFLSEQALFIRFSLSDLQLTIQSIQKQQLLIQDQGLLLDLQTQFGLFAFKGQTYFKPRSLMSIYRIDNQHYTKKLVSSIDYFCNAVTNKQGHIQEVVTLDQIYECLKYYYFDQRVSEYIAKIENSQLQYFLTSLEVSPNGKDIFLVIDLLGTKKQYVGLYKHIGQQFSKNPEIYHQNVIFNFHPQVALRDNGQLYCIQRNDAGLFIQFTRIKFQPYYPKTSKTSASQQQTKQIDNLQIKKNQQILYKCPPYYQLKILNKNQAQISTENYNIISNNILLEQNDVGVSNNNRIYLILHNNNNKNDFHMQLVTANNKQLKTIFQQQNVVNRFPHIQHWETQPLNFYTQCHEIKEVGYLLLRYQFTGASKENYLKYGHNQKFTRYITLIPYTKTKITIKNTDNMKQLPQNQTSKLPQLSHNTIQQQQQQNKVSPYTSNFSIELPSQQNLPLISEGDSQQNQYKLDISKEHIIYVCNEKQFMTELFVKHSSLSNVYLLVNKSIQAVFNRHSLYVHPLRQNVCPYSIYLDGFPITLSTQNNSVDPGGRVSLKLNAPLLPVNLQYTLWKKQLSEKLNKRIYTQNLTITEQNSQRQIKIKLVSSSKFTKKQKKQAHQGQPIILYLPSKNEKLDEIIVQKLIEKGAIFVQIVQCRGIFATNVVDLLRGTKELYKNYVEDIKYTIIFIREHIGEHVGVYAEGPSSCYATLLLNIQENEYFDCSVLHQGIYDLSVPHQQGQYFFGSQPSLFKQANPFTFPIFDQTKSKQKDESQSQYQIHNLQNTLFSTLSPHSRVQSRKFINKLRSHSSTIFETVFLKQFDDKSQKDIFNLSYLYKITKDNMTKQYQQFQKKKYQVIKSEGTALSRHSDQKRRNYKK